MGSARRTKGKSWRRGRGQWWPIGGKKRFWRPGGRRRVAQFAKQLASQLLDSAINPIEPIQMLFSPKVLERGPDCPPLTTFATALSERSGQRPRRSDRRSVHFTSEPPGVRVVDVSEEEWRGKRRTLRHIAQRVEQNRKDWLQEQHDRSFRPALPGDQVAPGTQTPQQGVQQALRRPPGGDTLTPPRAKIDRWSETIGEEMDFSAPPWLIGGSGATIEEGPLPAPGADSISTEVHCALNHRWADTLDEEMDFSIPPPRAIGGLISEAFTTLPSTSLIASDEGSAPPEPSGATQPLDSPEGYVGRHKAPSSPKMAGQGSGVHVFPCRSRWADEGPMKTWPPTAIPQC